MGRILIRGEAGHDIIPALYPLDGEIVIDKPGKGAFYATELERLLQNHGIENLLVCGVTTEVCVNTTVREANDRGYRCVVLADCCASYFPEFHEMGLKMIKAQGGIFGWVSDSAAVLEAMAPETSNNCSSGGIAMSTTTTASKSDFKPALWTPGDWNAFFGFGTNILVNMLVLTGLLRFVLKMPDSTGVRPHPAGARPDDVPVARSITPGSPIGSRRRPAATTSARCRRASACRTCSSSPS